MREHLSLCPTQPQPKQSLRPLLDDPGECANANNVWNSQNWVQKVYTGIVQTFTFNSTHNPTFAPDRGGDPSPHERRSEPHLRARATSSPHAPAVTLV